MLAWGVALVLSGCVSCESRTERVVVPVPSVRTTAPSTPTPTALVVRREGWSVTLPMGWVEVAREGREPAYTDPGREPDEGAWLTIATQPAPAGETAEVFATRVMNGHEENGHEIVQRGPVTAGGTTFHGGEHVAPDVDPPMRFLSRVTEADGRLLRLECAYPRDRAVERGSCERIFAAVTRGP